MPRNVGFLRAAEFTRCVNDVPSDELQQPIHGQSAGFNHALRSKHGFDEKVREIAVPRPRVFPRGFVRRGGGDYYTAFTAHLAKPRINRIEGARYRFHMQNFRAHSAGEAAIKEQHKTSRRNLAKPVCQLIERDSCRRKIGTVRVVSDELVSLRTVTREADDNRIVTTASRKALERCLNSGSGRILIDQQGSSTAQRVGEQGFQGDGISARATEPIDIVGRIPVDPDENALERHVGLLLMDKKL